MYVLYVLCIIYIHNVSYIFYALHFKPTPFIIGIVILTVFMTLAIMVVYSIISPLSYHIQFLIISHIISDASTGIFIITSFITSSPLLFDVAHYYASYHI